MIAAVAALSLVVLSASAKLSAQASDAESSPRAVVDAFFRATDTGRWADAVAFLDLPPFARFFRQRVNTARADLPRHDTATPEQLMAGDSTLPRTVAEWQAQKLRQATSQMRFGDFSREFAGITSFKALQALTPEEAAARWLEAQHPATRLRLAMANLKCASPIADSVVAPFRQRTLGAVVIDDTKAYVLVTDGIPRDDADIMYGPMPAVLHLRRREGWRLVPTSELLSGRYGGFGFGPQPCPRGGP